MATAVIDGRGGPAADGWPGDDFPAWMPAMLVKELRQGVQSGVFFWTFLLLQATLFVLVSVQVLVVDGGRDDPTFRVVFWLMAATAVAVIVPLRGLTAISGERPGNGLDLLQITRLSATRIVAGKWIAIVAQTAVVAVTLLPAVVLGYYFGGVDVVGQLEILGWIVAVGAVVAAAAIALSTLPPWLRIGLGFGVAAVAAGVAVVILDGPGWRVATVGPAAKAGILTVIAVHVVACLEFAAARVAPPAENHAARKRLLALALAATWPLVGWFASAPAAFATMLATGPLLFCYAVGATVERRCDVRAVAMPFRGAGRAGRLAAMLLVPGWASGLVFLALLGGVCLAGWLGFVDRWSSTARLPVAHAFASLLAALLVCPLPVVVAFGRVRQPLLLVLLVHLGCFLPFVFANAFKPYDIPWAGYETGRLVTLPFPLGAACSLTASCATRSVADAAGIAAPYTVAGLAVLGVVLAVMIRPWLGELAAVGRLLRGDRPRPPAPGRAVAVRAPAPAAPRPWTWRGDDFAAWLPPMLVRELRQGVQSGLFAWTFIGIQGVMFALMTWAVGTFGGDLPGAHGRDFALLFWLVIAAAVAVAVPLRGLTVVSGERLGNNLDLVRLTRLSATRIIVGKWLGLAGQALLVVVALLPYLVVRYFFGGVNVVVELEVFGWTAAASLLMAAAAVALSTLPVWARIGVVVAVVVVGFVPVAELFQRARMGRGGWAGLGAAERLAILAGLAVAIVALLEYAASRIAPPAENHASRKRLLAIALAMVWAAVGTRGTTEAFIGVLVFVGPLLLCYAIEALLEQPRAIRSLYRPFGRWGLPGQLAAAVFTPGWATAIPFVGLVAALCLAGWTAFFDRIIAAGREPESSRLIARTIGWLTVAAVLFPLPVLVWLPRMRPRLLLYGLVQGLCFLVFVYLAAVAPRDTSDSWRQWPGWVFALPFPQASLPAYFAIEPPSNGGRAFASLAIRTTAATTLVVLCVVAAPWLRQMRQVWSAVGRWRRPTGGPSA